MILSLLRQFRQNKSLLVCESDGFYFRASVLVRTGDELVALYHAESQQAAMSESVGEVFSNLKQQGWTGNQAILLSPSVLSALLELPVNPKKPRPIPQMKELVRWEAEPLLAQHTTQWSVGNLLISRGYMTQEQAAAVLDVQRGKPNPAGGLALAEQFSFRRFGELAEELGYITRSQLNVCLAGQDWLKTEDEEIECGWSAQGEVADIPGAYHWLVSCVNKSLLTRWVDLFHQHGVTLTAMYPLTGSSTPLLPEDWQEGVMLELHSSQAMAIYLKHGHIHQQYLAIHPEKSPLDCCLESFHALNIDSDLPVRLALWQPEAGLTSEIKLALGCNNFELLAPTPVSETVSPGMVGAAQHAMLDSGTHLLAQVKPGGPSPAFWQRFEVRLGALIGLLLILILIVETVFYLHAQSLAKKKAELAQQWQLIDKAMRNIKSDIRQVEQRKQELKNKQANYQKAKLRVTFFGESLPRRAELVNAILGVLQQVVTEDVVIDSLDEDPKRVTLMPKPTLPAKQADRVEVESFNLKAWAATETAAQTFIQSMQDALSPWDMTVRDSQVVSRPGPLNLDGFAITMRLVKLRDAKAVKDEVAVP